MAVSDPVSITRKLARDVEKLSFAHPVAHVYNPMSYGFTPYQEYLERYGTGQRDVLMVGMNPGPWGMVQTGVPFGDVHMVRDWLRLQNLERRPKVEHPKCRVQGFDCTRREGSGKRLWGWAKKRYGTPERFFSKYFVYNYCPLAFLETSGRNRPPVLLPRLEQKALYDMCNPALARLVAYYQPKYLIAIGDFAERRIAEAVPDFSGTLGRILHPSPANPRANKGWEGVVEQRLIELGIEQFDAFLE